MEGDAYTKVVSMYCVQLRVEPSAEMEIDPPIINGVLAGSCDRDWWVAGSLENAAHRFVPHHRDPGTWVPAMDAGAYLYKVLVCIYLYIIQVHSTYG